METMTACIGMQTYGDYTWYRWPSTMQQPIGMQCLSDSAVGGLKREVGQPNHVYWCPRCEMGLVVAWAVDSTPPTCPPFVYKHPPIDWTCTHPTEIQKMEYLGQLGVDTIKVTKADQRLWR